MKKNLVISFIFSLYTHGGGERGADRGAESGKVDGVAEDRAEGGARAGRDIRAKDGAGAGVVSRAESGAGRRAECGGGARVDGGAEGLPFQTRLRVIFDMRRLLIPHRHQLISCGVWFLFRPRIQTRSGLGPQSV